jgi:hypothetical protein
MNNEIKIIFNINDIAETASEIDVYKYKQLFFSCFNKPGTEDYNQYFSINKNIVSSLEEAIIILFLVSLFENEEWWNCNDIISNREWKYLLKKIWIPEYFNSKENETIKYSKVSEEYFRENNIVEIKNINKNMLFDEILKENIHIYASDNNAWNGYQYIIDNKNEYILFELWTTA